jgi:inosine-uridine nucleoside N-ribohydrolase
MNKVLSSLLLISYFSLTSVMASEDLLFDTDSAYFSDDGMALAMLLKRPTEFEVKAVTTVAGNYAPLQGVEYMAHVLDLMKRSDIPLFLGEERPLRNNLEMFQKMKKDFGLTFAGAFERPLPIKEHLELPAGGKFSSHRPEKERAVNYILKILIQSQTPITVVALGPLTNIARALQKNPEIVKKIKRLIFMGGNIHVAGNVTPYAEFNFWFDPEAAQLVLNSPIPEKIMVPLDLTNQFLLNKALYDDLVSKKTPLTDLIREDLGKRDPGFEKNPKATRYIWDALVTEYMLDPFIITKSEKQVLDVVTEFGPKYGSVNIRKAKQGEIPITILTGLDVKRHFDLLKQLMQSE